MDISTSSINRWIHEIAYKLYPLYAAIVERVLSTDYIQEDETTLAINDRPGKTRKAYLWAIRSALTPDLFFHYDYAFDIWLRLSRYCSDSRFQIDNNGVENAIRPIAVGRKKIICLPATTTRLMTAAYYTR